MPAEHMQILNGAVFADLGLQQHTTLDAGLTGQRWIIRLYFVNHHTLGHTLGYADPLRSRHFGYGHRGGTDDSADDAAHLSTGNTARNAANYAGIAGGGASSSLIISTFLGILVGVRSWLFTISVCTCFTM